MDKVLLDTDIVINLLKKEETFVSRFIKLSKKGIIFYYNPIIIAEVYAGAFKRELETIDALFDKLENIDICKFTGIQAGKYANEYKKAFHTISLEDYIIASCAKINSLILWTNNKKHYPMDDIDLV